MLRSLSNRLIIAISAVVLLLGVLGALLVSRISDLGETTQEILHTNAHSAAAMSKMRDAAQAYGLATNARTRARVATRFVAAWQGFKDDSRGLHVAAERARVEVTWKAYHHAPDAIHLRALDGALKDLKIVSRTAITARERHAIVAIKNLTIFASLGLGASLLVILVLSVWMVQLILRPMRQLARGIHDLNPSGAHRELERYGLSEFDDLTREFNGLLRRLDKHERGTTDRLVYENAKIDALINSIDDGLILLDRQDKILHVNFMAGMLLQTEPGELLGRNINDLNIATRFYMNLRNA
ncbi:PAS domain-containing protein, partial [Acidiferrobacter sp.]|uniref:PAS domain-containing protein n=1 Tax=Acidiferrobacter sp. TaxID=1872107 RepID=UPI0026390047